MIIRFFFFAAFFLEDPFFFVEADFADVPLLAEALFFELGFFIVSFAIIHPFYAC